MESITGARSILVKVGSYILVYKTEETSLKKVFKFPCLYTKEEGWPQDTKNIYLLENVISHNIARVPPN